MGFQNKTMVDNLLQWKIPNLPKMFVVHDQICCKVIGCQKSL
jgi:hypothetical protein